MDFENNIDFEKTISDVVSRGKSDIKAIEKSIEDLESLEKNVRTIPEYILLKYNQCCLYAFTKDDSYRDKLDAAMKELNIAVKSRFVDDSCCDEELFYNLARLNFVMRNYEMALELLERSSRKEPPFESSASDSGIVERNNKKALIRIKKRCIKAYCQEYIALNNRKLDSIRDVIYDLIGLDVRVAVGSSKPCGYIRSKLSAIVKEISDNNIVDTVGILEAIYKRSDSSRNEDSGNPCLYALIKKYSSGENKHIRDDKQRDEEIRELAHALAHCLSEGFATRGRTFENTINGTRIADCLMTSLGEDYVACYATLKIESDEYFCAIGRLNRIKDDKQKELSDLQEEENAINQGINDGGEKRLLEIKQKKEKLPKEIAQINFYIWYFSVIAERSNDGASCKSQFKEYCESSKDSVANSYYHVVHMKDQLNKKFSRLLNRNMFYSDEAMNALEKEYSEFCNAEPSCSMSPIFIEEWKSIRVIYETFKECNEIFKLRNIPEEKMSSEEKNARLQYSSYKLEKQFIKANIRTNPKSNVTFCEEWESSFESAKKRQLTSNKAQISALQRGNNGASTTLPETEEMVELDDGVPKTSNEETKGCYVITMKNGEQLICVGDLSDFAKTCDSFNVQIENIKPKPTKASIKDACKTCGNVVALPNSNNIHQVNNVLKCVTDGFETTLNIYIDTSSVNNDNIDPINMARLKDLNNDRRVYFVNNKKTAIMETFVCAHIEENVALLRKPINSYVIAPVDETDSYDYQSINSLTLVGYEGIKSFDIGAMIDWSEARTACAIGERPLNRIGKRLNVERVREEIGSLADNIRYVFYIEKQNEELVCYVFDLSRAVDRAGRFLYSDKKLLKGSVADNFLLSINRVRSRKDIAGNHEECTILTSCCSVFLVNPLDNDNYYSSLKYYIHHCFGVSLQDKEQLFIQDIGICSDRQSGSGPFVLAILQREIDSEDDERNLCGKLRRITEGYITDTTMDDDTRANSKKKILDELVNDIKPYDLKKDTEDYYFISYRSHGGTFELCYPVFKDANYLNSELMKSNKRIAIDARCFVDDFTKEEKEYLEDPRCKGAFVYISPEYALGSGSYEQDNCYKEIELINKRKANDPRFMVYLICIGEAFKNTEYYNASPVQMGLKLKEELHKTDAPRERSFGELLRADQNGLAERSIVMWKNDGSHFGERNHLQNHLNLISKED